VYRAAQELALRIYAVASALPDGEQFELSRQLRRAAVSVGSNIAEGCGRASRRDLCHFLTMALGSATELEFQLDLCAGARLAPHDAVAAALDDVRSVQRMLTCLIRRIKTAEQSPQQ
jgi:four helix bundle protein